MSMPSMTLIAVQVSGWCCLPTATHSTQRRTGCTASCSAYSTNSSSERNNPLSEIQGGRRVEARDAHAMERSVSRRNMRRRGALHSAQQDCCCSANSFCSARVVFALKVFAMCIAYLELSDASLVALLLRLCFYFCPVPVFIESACR